MDRDARPWYRDPHLWAALVVALALRAAPMLVWGWSDGGCTRDECIYRQVAAPILQGGGVGVAPAGWLPAPGYPWLLALTHRIAGSFEAVKWVQWALTLPTLAVLWTLGRRVGGLSAARWTAWLTALHPTLAFFVGTMWTESVYVLLLSSTALAALWARDGRWTRALLAGGLLGLTVLTRGVATYMAPLVLLALLAPDRLGAPADLAASARRRSRHGVAFLAALVLTVSPYAVSASQRFGGVVISDATQGHVLGLGNDAYPPVTFDYGVGQLTGRLYTRTLKEGRPPCPRRQGPVVYDRCETERALAWAAEHPGAFAARVPTRVAQLLNPHSFLTRHLRWNQWPGIPWALKEGLVAWQAAWSAGIVLLGTVGAWAWARGPFGLLSVGVVVYNVAVVAMAYGLTRFRLPLEPLWTVWLACLAAHPRVTLTLLRTHPGRALGAVLTLPLLAVLTGWYAWTGWPGVWR